MKKILLFALLLPLASCEAPLEQREYRAADGSVAATAMWRGDDSTMADWQFKGADGLPLVPGCDSLRVIERGPEGHPMTVCFFTPDGQRWMQFYSTMALRSVGMVRNGMRDGVWTFYHANGNKQSECTFVNGKEEGDYRVFRDNGVPYYVGRYHNGQRIGTWEIYNSDGTLATTHDYGN